MQRVLVIGSPGAGKSTLATELARRTGLPLFHLDQLKWQAGWIECDDADFRTRLAAVLAGPRWIIDGNYGVSLPQRLARADTVIDLDLPAWRCLVRALGRVRRLHGTVRPDMAPGCPEQYDLEFLLYIARFPFAGRQRIEASLEDYQGNRVRLSRSADVERFLDSLAHPA